MPPWTFRATPRRRPTTGERPRRLVQRMRAEATHDRRLAGECFGIAGTGIAHRGRRRRASGPAACAPVGEALPSISTSASCRRTARLHEVGGCGPVAAVRRRARGFQLGDRPCPRMMAAQEGHGFSSLLEPGPRGCGWGTGAARSYRTHGRFLYIQKASYRAKNLLMVIFEGNFGYCCQHTVGESTLPTSEAA